GGDGQAGPQRDRRVLRRRGCRRGRGLLVHAHRAGRVAEAVAVDVEGVEQSDGQVLAFVEDADQQVCGRDRARGRGGFAGEVQAPAEFGGHAGGEAFGEG